MTGDLSLEGDSVPNQENTEIEVPDGSECAIDDHARRVVTAHGIDGDPNHDSLRRWRPYSSSTARTWRPA